MELFENAHFHIDKSIHDDHDDDDEYCQGTERKKSPRTESVNIMSVTFGVHIKFLILGRTQLTVPLFTLPTKTMYHTTLYNLTRKNAGEIFTQKLDVQK